MTMPKRVLIVDGEAAHAAVLSRQLAALCRDWELTVFQSSAETLKHLETQPCDVLVCDMTLPDSTGPQLLNEVGRLHPEVLRFIMAETIDKELVMKCVLGSNHFLPKPCAPEDLQKAVERAITLDKWLNDDALKSLVLKIRTFPSIPSLYFEVLRELRSPDADARRVGEIISKDLAMSTKVLQVLNSAYYAIPRQITDPTEAVNMLGFEMVKSLVLCIQVFSQFDKVKPVYFSIDKLWRHSTEVAQSARQIARFENLGAEAADEVYTAGLLHDIGKLVLVSNFCEPYGEMLQRIEKDKIPLCEAEKETFGASHAQIGAYLIGLWGMPLAMAEAACFHHNPKRIGTTAINTVALVHAANAIVSEPRSGVPEGEAPLLDEVFLSRVGYGGRSATWRNLIHSKVDDKPGEPDFESTETALRWKPVKTSQPDELPRWVVPLALGGAILLCLLAILRALKVV